MGDHNEEAVDYTASAAEDRALLFKALNAAVRAFERVLDKTGVDGAFFAIKVHGWELSTDGFQPLNRGVVIDMRERPKKERKNEHR